MMKLDSQQVSSGIIIMLLGWGAFQLYGMNANMAVVSYKVEENYNMIKPMWQDFLIRSAKYDEHKSQFHSIPGVQASVQGE
jgi:hypothetical protein